MKGVRGPKNPSRVTIPLTTTRTVPFIPRKRISWACNCR